MEEDPTLLDVCGVDDVSPDLPFKARIGDEDVAVFQKGDAFYVTQDLCTHGPGSLAEGYVEGDEIECPFHQGKFSFVTGQPTAAPCTIPLKIWDVVVRGQRVCARRP